MRKVVICVLIGMLASALNASAAPLALGVCQPPIPISFTRTYEPFTSPHIEFTPVGGQVFVSNAPESIWDDGATRADGSLITGQLNATLYRDHVTGAFRFWASHHNRTSGSIAFWVVAKNNNDHPIRFYRSMEGYSNGSVTGAAGDATTQFMRAQPEQLPLATIQPGETFFFRYSADVMPNQASVYIAEFRAATPDGNDATVEISHVVTRSDITDPTPFAATPTIARTNATLDRSDDYRGLLQAWGRTGRITLTLDNVSRVKGLKLGDLGYPGEQEPLISSYNTMGQPTQPRQVRFVTATLNRLRLAYWYTDYQIEVQIDNRSSYPVIHTLFGSNGSNPGFVSYQIDGQNVTHCHFSTNHVVPISQADAYTLRTMVMPSSLLPFAIYFVVGDEDGILQGAR